MQTQPLISVVIPCYNQGRYLGKAIESVLAQTYKHYEIVVVDDGSIDHTKSIADKFPEVIYVHQDNQGLSAARNTGIDHSKGEYLVFLDADDWLLLNALEINLSCIIQKPGLAFVSGGYQLFYEKERNIVEVKDEVKENNYCRLLKGNYIGMIATVLFQRWIFDTYRYDVSLGGCEDYDLYLKITRKYPVFQHTQLIAVYRIHNENMSGNAAMMLETVLQVLNRQKQFLTDWKEKNCFKKGLKDWKFYAAILYSNLAFKIQNNHPIDSREIIILKSHYRYYYYKFIVKRILYYLKRLLSKVKLTIYKIIPDFIIQKIKGRSLPKLHQVNLGDLNRTSPFSIEFGYDRGGPVDRYYIENFLERNKVYIRGKVLEIGDNEYTLRFGASSIETSDILHIDDHNPNATFVGDLSEKGTLPANTFDCIILTQTLHLIYNYQKALETCYYALKPDGVLLLTVPGISYVDRGEWKDFWFWAFTDNAIRKMLAEFFPAENVKIETHGNVLAATGFLYGMGLPELRREQMDEMDPHYQVIITAIAIKL